MSKTINIKRNQLLELMDAYGKAATLHLSEGESADDVKRFKYAAGKNYNTLHALAKKTERIQRRMQNDYHDPELDAFNQDRIKLCEQYAEHDENGSPKFRQYEDGRPREYIIEAALKDEFQKQVNDLKAAYADAIAADAANDEATNAVLDEDVEVKLHSIDWAKVPVAVSGSYVDLIAGMIENLPTFEDAPTFEDRCYRK